MSSLATISALIILSYLPVAHADLNCDFSIGDTNICSWANYHGGVIIAVVGAIVALVAFLGLSLYTSLFRRPNASPALMNYAPRDEPQVPIQQVTALLPPVHQSPYEARPYAFSVPGESWQTSRPSAPDKEWTNVDLSRNAYSAYPHPPGY